jgi:hypothetical protein
MALGAGRGALVVVRPGTVVRWHRAGFRLFWRWRSRPGRLPIPLELRRLIRWMAKENPLWGQERIANELRGLARLAKLLQRVGAECPLFRRSLLPLRVAFERAQAHEGVAGVVVREGRKGSETVAHGGHSRGGCSAFF